MFSLIIVKQNSDCEDHVFDLDLYKGSRYHYLTETSQQGAALGLADLLRMNSGFKRHFHLIPSFSS